MCQSKRLGGKFMSNKLENESVQTDELQNEFTIVSVEKTTSTKAKNTVEKALDAIGNTVLFIGSLYSLISCLYVSNSIKSESPFLVLGMVAPIFWCGYMTSKGIANGIGMINGTFWEDSKGNEEQDDHQKVKVK